MSRLACPYCYNRIDGNRLRLRVALHSGLLFREEGTGTYTGVPMKDCARLLDAGLVSRHPSPDDHRAHLLALTPTGTAALERIRPMVGEFNTMLTRVLGADGPASLAAALRTLRDADEFR